MPRPCHLRHPDPKQFPGCALCRKYLGDDRYRRLWDGEPALGTERLRLRRPCFFRGAETGDVEQCGTCPKGNRQKVFQCVIHGTCTVGRPVPGRIWCMKCNEYSRLPDPFPGPVVRDLCYHIYPVRSGNWRWNVAELLKRMDLFNGKRLVAVAVDNRTDSADEVKAAFGDTVTEFIVQPNQTQLREVATFEPLFERVADPDPCRAVLWAHAKGATRPPGHSSRLWAELLYRAYLDHWPGMQELLQWHSVAGAFRMRGQFWKPNSVSDWAFSGSWCWFRSGVHFAPGRDWRKIDRFWSGIETYPALHYPHEDSGCLVCDNCGNLYEKAHLRGKILPELEAWEQQQREVVRA